MCLKRWAVPQNVILGISYRLGLPNILLICLSIPFLIIPCAHTITGTMVVVRCPIHGISIFRSLYLLILLNSLTDILLSVGIEISISRLVLLLLSLITVAFIISSD